MSTKQKFPAEYPSDQEYERWVLLNEGSGGRRIGPRGRNNYPVLPSESIEAYFQNESLRVALRDEV
jgi:hypothetical protein